MTSGETTDAMMEALQSIGVKPRGIAVLAAVKGGEAAHPTQLMELAKTISGATGVKLRDVYQDVLLAHQNSRSKLVLEALRESRQKPKEVYEHVTRKAQAIRKAL